MYTPLGGLYLEGRFNGWFFGLPVCGAYIWRGLFSEFYGNLTNFCGEKKYNGALWGVCFKRIGMET